jgi:hypothetical protein
LLFYDKVGEIMELITMFIAHLIKSAEYFLVEGLPVVPVEHWAEIPGAIAFNLAKLITIYLSIL